MASDGPYTDEAHTRHAFPAPAAWRRACVLLLAALSLADPLAAGAAALGKLTVRSALGEPLLAEIEIEDLRPGEADSVTARMATPGMFARANLEMAPALSSLRFSIARRGAKPVVRISTATPPSELAFEILVELQWKGGSDLRRYSLYLEPREHRLKLARELSPAAAAGPLQPPAGEQRGSSAPPPSLAPRLTLDHSLDVVTREAAPSDAESSQPRPLPLEVFINGTRAGDWVLLDVKGIFHATADAFEEWRLIRSPDAAAVQYRGQPWYPLSSVRGYEAQFNAATQSVNLKFSASAFATTRLAQPIELRPAITPPVPAAFANYDLSYTRTATQGLAAANDVGALTELGASGSLGVLTTTTAARNLNGDAALGPRSVRRLETTFSRDFPDTNTTLRLGDSSTRPGTWGRQVYFGGVQLGTNFSLAPGFITQPLPTIRGQSSAPSTVELYVNDALRQTSSVPSGPFTIDNYPQITGTGQARLVVRDLLGRETVLVQNLFTSSYLLKQGLSDWGVQAGALRRNLGIESANYGEGFGSGLYRYGVNDNTTLEGQAEASQSTRGAGFGVSTGLFGQVLGQGAVALSDSNDVGTGRLVMIGAEHLSVRHGLTLHAEAASRDYRRIGVDPISSYSRQTLASYSYFTQGFGQLGVAYAHVKTFDIGVVDTYSANWSFRVGAQASLTFTATRVTGENSGTAVGVNLLIPLDDRVTVSGSITRRDGHTDGYLAASRTLGAEAGFGWRALAGQRTGQTYGEGGLYYQGSHGLATADVSVSDTQQVARLGAQGGLVAIDGGVYASRKLEDSFALVEVPGYPDVGVGFQSTVLSRTDQDGKALVPRLMPYRRNSIRLDPSELPISAELDSIEQIAVPPSRSGVKITFPVRSGRGALVTIRFDDGQPAPAGAEVELVGDKETFYVARRGEAFVTGMQPKNKLRLRWSGKSCELDVALPQGGDKDEIARLGPYVCKGVTR